MDRDVCSLFIGDTVIGNLEGTFQAAGVKVGIVVSRFNSLITKQLLDGAKEAIRQFGGLESDITVAHVPGSFEIPLIAKEMAVSGNYDAIIALGAVIRGETDHYDHVAGQAASGIARVSLDTGVPVIFGILTTDTVEQALQRCGVKGGNKGYEAASSAVEMVSLLRRVRDASGSVNRRAKVTAV